MIHFNLISAVFLFFLICVTMVTSQFPAQSADGHQTLGLYNNSDEVVELTTKNFNQSLYGSQRIWLVEFYNVWCGHCRRYAPVYKAVADYFKEGKDLFVVAAVNCANEINQPLCRQFRIVVYPTLRYFHENFVQGSSNLGTEVSVTGVFAKDIQIINEKLAAEQKENRAQMLPKLSPYTHSDVSQIFNHSNVNAQFAFLILNNDSGLLAVKTALVFHRVPNIFITHSLESNGDLTKSLNVKNVKEYPTLIIITHQNNRTSIEDKLSKVTNMTNEIETFLKSKGIDTNQYLNQTLKPELSHPSKNEGNGTNSNVIKKVKEMGDAVFQMDLENTLRYSLRQEVGNFETIAGEKLGAFRKYLQVLVKYVSLGRKSHDFLNSLNYFAKATDSIEGFAISALVKNSEKNSAGIWSSPEGWIGCKGSVAGSRGFPCGLWTMFHYLTVQAAKQNIGKISADPKEVLLAMHGYIKNFFGCHDCSQHFQKMAAERKIESVSSFDDAIMWLWAAHNEVNQRLAGDATEDPEFPKQQFPTSKRCPRCRFPNGSWNKYEVEKYLKHMYGNIYIGSFGTDY